MDKRAKRIHEHKLKRRRHNRFSYFGGKSIKHTTGRFAHGARDENDAFPPRKAKPMRNKYAWDPVTKRTVRI